MNTVVTSRQALLAASRTVARRQGLDGLSIRAVAAEARVSVGSVYNYFSGKTELLAATVEEIWMQILSAPEGEAPRLICPSRLSSTKAASCSLEKEASKADGRTARSASSASSSVWRTRPRASSMVRRPALRPSGRKPAACPWKKPGYSPAPL